ncbi:hypothetical protein BHQ17_08960 [Mycolicibacterium holsaticum]|uniref:Uncharacterized protein n=1 Tax=Mycolicibacterium holsaticum TaxID=152142 RepID=A0A1E3RX69_9MYCO|nr:hypothetical protein BHQ17_08960 [Mycolicibacterium holsaticum]
MVSSPIHLLAHQLFGGCVCDRAHGHVGSGDTTGVFKWSRDPEVREKDIGFVVIEVGNDDVGWFDVAVQQAFPVGIVEGAGYGADYADSKVNGHACRILLREKLRDVGAVDVVHGGPQVIFVFTSVVNANDVRMS